MKIIRTFYFVVLIGALGVTQNAHASHPPEGTQAGLVVSNQAAVTFNVGTTTPSQTVTSPPATFVVDLKVALTVETQESTYVDLTPTNKTNRHLKFKVTNNSNGPVNLGLEALSDPNTTTDPFGGQDNFDTDNVRIYRDSNTNGAYDGGDELITFINSVPSGHSETVFVVSSVLPNVTRQGGDIASMVLRGTAKDPTTNNIYVNSTGPDDPTTVQTVLADGQGKSDADKDSKHSDRAAYRFVSANLTVTKTVKLISDPVNGTTTPRAIPGAIVEYCIVAENTGNTQADNVVMTDNIPTNSTYATGTIYVDGTMTGNACNSQTGTLQDDDATGNDDDITQTDKTGNFDGTKVTTTIKALPGTTKKISLFRVQIK